MIIKLPKNFTYLSKKQKLLAYTKNNTLYMHRTADYEKVMYALTYKLYPYQRCYYCGTPFTTSNRTIDHIFPRVYGGVSITNNMLPTCRNCNSHKSALTGDQFRVYRSCKTEAKKAATYDKFITKNEYIIDSSKFVLPDKWITFVDTDSYAKEYDATRISPQKQEAIKRYYSKHKQFPHPIIISSNGWILKGTNTLVYAKKIRLKKVPAIIIDNCIIEKGAIH